MRQLLLICSILTRSLAQDVPQVISSPQRINIPRAPIDANLILENFEEKISEIQGGGKRELLGRLHLTENGDSCPFSDGPCESKPVFIPTSTEIKPLTFNHAGAVYIQLNRMGAEVRYTLDGSEPTKHSPGVIEAGSGGGLIEIRIDPPCPTNRFANLSKPTYCAFHPSNRNITLKARTMGRGNNTLEDSAVTQGNYSIWTGRHGRAMLVPYYHGQANEQDKSLNHRYETGLGYSGKLVEVELNTMLLKTVHMHDIITDFAEYTQFVDGVTKTNSLVDSDTVGLDVEDSADSDNKFMDAAFSSSKTPHEFYVTAQGVEPFPVTSRWSRSLGNVPYAHQVKVIDLASEFADSFGTGLRGFWSGFSAVSPTTGIEYGFLVPFFDGTSYSGLAVRVDMLAFHNATEETRRDAIKVLNFTHSRAKGFAGGFSFDGYAYFVPMFDGIRAGSLVVRVGVDDFSSATEEVLDLADPDTPAGSSDADDDPNFASEVPRKSLSGFQGGRSYTDSSGETFGLLVPYRNSISPIHGVDSKLTADGFTGLDVMRESEAIGGGRQEVHYASTVVRFSLSDFSTPSVTTLDLAAVDPRLRGFSDGVVVGKFLYLVPYKNHDSNVATDQFGYFGMVVRIDLEEFDGYKSVKVMDLRMLDDCLVGFSAGFSWGKLLLLVPNRNAQGAVKGTSSARKANKGSYMKRAQHGKVVGIDLTKDFNDLSSVSVLDLSTVTRQQIPKIPDPELRGFVGGFAAGDYAYFVPHSNGVFFGKLVRIDMRDFEALAKLQRKQFILESEHALKQRALGVRVIKPLKTHDGTDDGSRTGTNSLGHDGVQIVDLQWQDKELCGFSGGFATVL